MARGVLLTALWYPCHLKRGVLRPYPAWPWSLCGHAQSLDGRHVAAGSFTGEVFVLDVETETPLFTLQGQSSPRSSGTRRLAPICPAHAFPSIEALKHAVCAVLSLLISMPIAPSFHRCHVLSRMECRVLVTGHSKAVRSLSYAVDGYTLITASDDGRVNTFEM